MVIPDVCIDGAHRISKINDRVVVHFTSFTHRTMFYRNRKAIKGEVTVHLVLTRFRLDLLY